MSRRARKKGRSAKARARRSVPPTEPARAPVDPASVIARWTAPHYVRGNKVFELEVAGPVVTASSPEQLREATELVTERDGTPDVN